jgi:signal transduction histidine kinase
MSLTTNVLDITRIETNSLSLHKEPVDLRVFLLEHMMDYEKHVMNDIECGYKRQLNNEERYNSRLDFSQLNKHDSHDSFLAEVDRSRVSQVISNLLDNAFKFTSEGEVIEMEIKREEINYQKYAVITIKDNGRGIHTEILPRLFTKFATKSEKGTGLGLFICKSIIESHGGQIWAENNNDGKGATFSFSLPLMDPKNNQ